MTPKPTHHSGHIRFHSIEEYESLTSDNDTRSLQLDQGPLQGECRRLDLGDVVVRRFSINRAIEDKVWITPGWTTFGLAARERLQEVVWCGVCSRPDTLGVIRSGREHEWRMPAHWDGFEIDVSDRLLSHDGLLPESLWKRVMNPEHAQLPVDRITRQRLQYTLARLLGDESTCGVDDGAAMVLTLLGDAMDKTLKQLDILPRLRPAKRHALVRKARQLMQESLQQALTIDTLSRELETSPRALERAFREQLGISPYQYQLCLRLDAVRRELKYSRDMTVTDLALQYGFTSSSRFSGYYKRLFGETPSATRRVIISLDLHHQTAQSAAS